MDNHDDIDATANVDPKALAVRVTQAAPRDLYRVATDVAGICREIVIKTSKKIGTRDYVCIEGWQAISTAHGCMLSIDSVTEDADGNVIAIASVNRMADGLSLARAEGFVGSDEKMWAGRQRYARRAMAQTRAMSRAARSAFAHVVVLIDAGLSTTPAEEMIGAEQDDYTPPTAPQQRQRPRPATAAQANREPEQPDNDDAQAADDERFMDEVVAAYAARGLTQHQASLAQRHMMQEKEVENVLAMGPTWRKGYLAAIASGAFDRFKDEPEQPTQPAAPARTKAGKAA